MLRGFGGAVSPRAAQPKRYAVYTFKLDMIFRDRLKKGEQLIGTLLTLGSANVAEVLSYSALDWLFLDLEHSAMGTTEAERLIQAIGGRVATLIRVESKDEVGIRKALDIGADGIIIPQVNSRIEAERVVALAKFPPEGIRSIGLSRASNFGNQFADYISQANSKTSIIIQIEHIDALNEIEDIISVKGIDAIFVGPYDLSGSLGILGQVDAPEMTKAISKIISTAKEKGVIAGIFAGSGSIARKYLEQGFSLIAVASDGTLLGRAATSELKLIKD